MFSIFTIIEPFRTQGIPELFLGNTGIDQNGFRKPHSYAKINAINVAFFLYSSLSRIYELQLMKIYYFMDHFLNKI